MSLGLRSIVVSILVSLLVGQAVSTRRLSDSDVRKSASQWEGIHLRSKSDSAIQVGLKEWNSSGGRWFNQRQGSQSSDSLPFRHREGSRSGVSSPFRQGKGKEKVDTWGIEELTPHSVVNSPPPSLREELLTLPPRSSWRDITGEYAAERKFIGSVLSNDQCFRDPAPSALGCISCICGESVGAENCKEAMYNFNRLPPERRGSCQVVKGAACRPLTKPNRHMCCHFLVEQQAPVQGAKKPRTFNVYVPLLTCANDVNNRVNF